MKYKLTSDEIARVAKDFTYHSPKEDQFPRYHEIRETAAAVAAGLMQNCPPSRERSLALTALEECVMWANASIARNE